MVASSDMHGLLSNLSNSDKDHRYMATSDLLAALQQSDWRQPSSNDDCTQLCSKVVKQLDDASGDISALAVKCLVALGHKVSAHHIQKMLEMMCQKIVAPRKKDHNDSTFIGLKALVTEIPDAHGSLVASICTPILVSGLDGEGAIKSECLALLSSVFARFGEYVSPAWPVMEKLLRELSQGTTSIAKKAIPCIPALAVHLDDSRIEELMKELTQCVQASKSSEAAQTCMQAVAACAKALGFRFGPYVGTILPLVMERCSAASNPADADSGSGAEEKEAAVHAVTAVVQYCSEVVKPHMDSVLALAKTEIAHDPNLADGGDVDMDASDDDDDYDDDDGAEFDDDEYNDDEDTSWKVRRAACLLVVALVQAYPDLAATLYTLLRPTLQSRFKEREESVKLDVFVAYSALVRQRGGTAVQADRAGLASDAASDTTALVKQLRNTRSAKLKAGVFEVLQALLAAAAGGAYHGSEAVGVCKDVLTDGSSPNALKIEVLRFLNLAFSEGSAPELLPHLPQLVPSLKRSLQDRYYKVVAEAVAVVERMALASSGSAAEEVLGHFRELFLGTLELLKAKDVDQEVKECSIRCVATMLSKLSSALAPNTGTALPLLCEKLRSEGTRYAAVNACKEVAAADPPLPLGPFIAELITLMTPFLRKAHRGLRYATLSALAYLLAHHAAGPGQSMEEPLLEGLLTEAAPLICDKDLLLAAAALQMCDAATKVDGAGSLQALPGVVEMAVRLACSTLLSGAAHDSLKSFFRSLPQTKPELPFEELRTHLLKAGADVPRAAQRSCCECAAALCDDSTDRVAETMRLAITELDKADASEAVQCLMLLLLGELGRISDLSAFPEVERFIVAALSEGREDVKATASLALGGVAVGNISQHLPLLLSRIAELDSTSPKQLYLLLKSLNEVLRTLLARGASMPEGQQEQVLQLLHQCMHVPDECRTMVSDCLAQLTFMSPGAMAKWLVEQLGSDAAACRGVAVAGVKHVMHDGQHAVPDLAQHLPEFLQRLEDPDHVVRKEAVQLLAAAAHARPTLAAPCLGASLPLLLNLTTVDQSLVRVVDLGPFKQTVDDGLTMRKHTFECIEGLLSKTTFQDKLDMSAIAGAVSQGLSDDKQIKPIAHTLLRRLCVLAPTAVLAQLKDMISPISKTLGQRLKDDAIPQEKERHEEMLKSTLTLVKAISQVPQALTMVPAFKTFLDSKVLNNSDLAPIYEKSGE